MEPVLDVTNLTKRFAGPDGPVTVLNSVSLRLERGQTLALTGESGSGKSTLLHAIAGLEPVEGGMIRIGGQAMTGADEAGRAELRRDRIGLVFQGFNLIPSLTVGANIAFQARLAGRHDPGRSAALAHRLGLVPHLAKYPEALSGGQQQRVAIARALLAKPALLLADEPTGSLDSATADQVLAEMLDLVAETGAALLMVTHSARAAAQLAGRMTLAGGRIA